MSESVRRPSELSHVVEGAHGAQSHMVDVGEKVVTARRALARARVRFPAGALARVLAGAGPKGPVTEVARVAGILAAKRTAEWIPMCHTLPLDGVTIEFAQASDDVLEVRCEARCHARTGVEMEAMVGASAAALTVYDMTKALGHGIAIESVELLEKQGGRSGHWRRGEG
jgi:cyclic pyranopterin phosphate synthase